MWIEFHDKDGRVEVSEMTFEGIHDAMFQCGRMLDELDGAKEELDNGDDD